MTFPSFLSYAGIAVLAVTAQSAPTHTWIADIKARRGTLAGQELRLEGEVVDVRAPSQTARRGFYRLTDASDPMGVLVRTEDVPLDGGSFRLRARVANGQMENGTLLLDELERDRTDARPMLPVIAVVGSGLALALLVVMFRRAHTEERRYAVAPPLWLLPDAGPYGKALAVGLPPVQPPLKYDPDLEEADRLQRDRLKRRKRGLLQAMLGSLALTGSSTAWVLVTKPVAGQVPAFIFIDSTDPTVLAQRPAVPPEDSVLGAGIALGGDSALRIAPVTRQDSARDQRNSTSLALTPSDPRTPEVPRSPRTPDSALAPADTARPDVVVPAPAPSPSPAPAPAPPPPPPPEVVAPPRDPEVDRARANTRLTEAAGRLVAAINGKRAADVALLMPEAMAGDLARRERFIKLIRDFGPRASLGSVDEATVTEDRAETRFAIAFAWRGDFGVDKKKTGRLLGVVRRDGDGWRFEGARLLDAVP